MDTELASCADAAALAAAIAHRCPQAQIAAALAGTMQGSSPMT
jgi:hypothetical protein